MASFHDDEPVAFPKVLCLPPNYLSSVIDDGQGMVVCCAYPESELRFNRVNLRGPIILGDEGVRVSRSVEHPIAGEVFSQGRTVEEAPERFESIGGPQKAVDRDAPALLDRLSGRIEDLHDRYRSGRDSHRRFHEVNFGAQTRDSKRRERTAPAESQRRFPCRPFSGTASRARATRSRTASNRAHGPRLRWPLNQ